MNRRSGFTSRDDNEQEHDVNNTRASSSSTNHSQTTRATATSTSAEVTTAPGQVIPFEIDQGNDSSSYPFADQEHALLVPFPAESVGVNTGSRSVDSNGTIDGDGDGEVRVAHNTSVDAIMAWAHIVDYPIVTAVVAPDVRFKNNMRTMFTGFCIGSLLMLLLFSLPTEWESGNEKRNRDVLTSQSVKLNSVAYLFCTDESNVWELSLLVCSNSSSNTQRATSSQQQSWMFWIQSRMSSISFGSSSSSEGKAFKWLMEDPYTISHNNDDCVVTRFGLAALFYATNGPTSWSLDRGAWLQSSAECGWGEPDVECFKDVVERLSLAGDGLSGSIPKEIGLLSGLTALYLFNNSLEGTIPSEIGLLTSLNELILFNNSLEGTIPSEIGLLKSLNILAVDNNRGLSGCLPTELDDVSFLSGLYVSGTNITGSVPSGLCLNLLDAEIDCAKIECDCCHAAITFESC